MVISFNKKFGITDIYIPQTEFRSRPCWLSVVKERFPSSDNVRGKSFQ